MCYRVLEPLVHCIPNGHSKPTTVFFRLEKEWIKLTEENITGAFKSLFPEVKDAEWEAKYLLKGIREVCKDLGKVSWRLPAIRRQEGGVE